MRFAPHCLALAPMVRRLMVAAVWASALLGGNAWGQAKAEWSELAGGDIELHFSLDRYTISSDAAGHTLLHAEGLTSEACQPGTPMRPKLVRIVALPAGSSLEIGFATVQSSSEALPSPLALAPHASTKETTPPPLVEQRDTAEHPFVSLTPLGRMADKQLFRICIEPFRMVGTQQIEVAHRIEAHFKTQRAEGGVRLVPQREGYVVVAPPQYEAGLQPFLRWKKMQGYDVRLVITPSRKRDSIKAMLAPLFADPYTAPSYLLLAGDAEQIQSYAGTTRPQGLAMHNTDLYYADYSGDYLPDVQLGRWPVGDSAQLRAVVAKTLAYEQLMMGDTAYLRRLLLVAGRESQQPAPLTTNGQVNYLKGLFTASNPSLDTLCFYNPTSNSQLADIQAAVRMGVGLVSYTGHCSVAGWTYPSVYYSTLDSLEAAFPTIYLNNCCKSNDFAGTCFGEQLLRKPLGGGVGVIGATNETLWNEDYYWVVGAKYPFSLWPVADSLWPGAVEQLLGLQPRVATLGQLLQAGNMAVTQSGSPYDKFYWEIYCLFGDPSLMPWIGSPRDIPLQANAADLAQGSTTVRVSTEPGARVSVMQADSVIGFAVADAQGMALVRLEQGLDTLPLLLTASGFGLVPRFDTLAIAPQLAFPLQFHDIAYEADTLRFGLLNASADTLRAVSLALVCDADSASAPSIALLLPGADTLVALPHPYAGLQQCHLVALGLGGDTLGRQWVELGHPLAEPDLRFRLLTADGEAAHSLAGGLTYRFRVEGPNASAVAQCGAEADGVPLGADTEELTFTLPDSVRHLRLWASVATPVGAAEVSHWVVGGNRIDGFENRFASYPWGRESIRPWQIDSAFADGGIRSAHSAPIDYRQTSDLGITLLLMADDSISFAAAVSSEQGYDKLLFSINDSTALTLSGEQGWQRYAFGLCEGVNHLRWRYVKDESRQAGADCAWIDNVQFPLALWDSTYGYFGSPSSLGIASAPRLRAPYPNPTTGAVEVEVSHPTTAVVYTLEGMPLHTLRLGTPGRHTLRIAEQAGLYLLRIEDCTYKIIVIEP